MRIPRGYSHPVKIGAGSFSTVLRGREAKLDRPVALKMMALRGRVAMDTVEKEARLLASISCSCVPRIYDIRRSSGSVTIVMEWIDGVPLSVFAETVLPSEVRRGVAADLVKALAQLHGCGIVHRDIKPENIMLVPGRGVVFVDFGFSGTGRTANGLSAALPLKGTPRYMAPELWASNDTVDYMKSDLYSLGMVLQELCAPEVPQCVAELLESVPSRRPDSCASFSRLWDDSCGTIDEGPVRSAVTQATAGHTSLLLYKGACELYGTGRRAEAYALLTESLDRWPDNPAAVAMVHDRFSLPIRNSPVRMILVSLAGTLLLLLALACAYISGTHSRKVVTAGLVAPAGEPEERRLTMRAFPADNNGHAAEADVVLRDLPGGFGPRGEISALLPGTRGKLYIDAEPLQKDPGNRCSVNLVAGMHRLEWYDSTTRRTVGETVDLLPFATRTVSLVRHSNER